MQTMIRKRVCFFVFIFTTFFFVGANASVSLEEREEQERTQALIKVKKYIARLDEKNKVIQESIDKFHLLYAWQKEEEGAPPEFLTTLKNTFILPLEIFFPSKENIGREIRDYFTSKERLDVERNYFFSKGGSLRYLDRFVIKSLSCLLDEGKISFKNNDVRTKSRMKYMNMYSILKEDLQERLERKIPFKKTFIWHDETQSNFIFPSKGGPLGILYYNFVFSSLCREVKLISETMSDNLLTQVTLRIFEKNCRLIRKGCELYWATHDLMRLPHFWRDLSTHLDHRMKKNPDLPASTSFETQWYLQDSSLEHELTRSIGLLMKQAFHLFFIQAVCTEAQTRLK